MTYDGHDTGEGHQLRVFPPHRPANTPCSPSESRALRRQSIAPVDQQVETFTALQDGVDVLDHNVFAAGLAIPFVEHFAQNSHIVQISPCLLKRVGGR
jgi:hypothetical protein